MFNSTSTPEILNNPMPTNNLSEIEILNIIRSKWGSLFQKDSTGNPTFEVTVEIASFIETQISLARAEMKAQILKTLPNVQATIDSRDLRTYISSL
jgi:ABC-type microcin C transport system duplicated ATPase subunit YejF